MGRPRTKPADRLLVATATGFWTSPEGDEYHATAGITIIEADHEFAQATPDWWKDVEPTIKRLIVEQATAAPGELRGEEDPEDSAK